MDRKLFEHLMASDMKPISQVREKEIIDISKASCPATMKGIIVMEELAELQQEVSKYIRGEGDRMGLLEEMADVYICLEFLRNKDYITEGFTRDEIYKAITIKLEREYSRRMER